MNNDFRVTLNSNNPGWPSLTGCLLFSRVRPMAECLADTSSLWGGQQTRRGTGRRQQKEANMYWTTSNSCKVLAHIVLLARSFPYFHHWPHSPAPHPHPALIFLLVLVKNLVYISTWQEGAYYGVLNVTISLVWINLPFRSGRLSLWLLHLLPIW